QIKEIVVDRIIYQDIPDVFNIREPNKVMGIVKLIASNPGMIINYETIARDFNTTRQTISNILDYLEETFLIKRLYNFSKNFLVSERKLKKWYPCDHGIINAYGRGVEKGKIIETVIVNYLNARFFWRTPQKDEVDVIEEKLIPIEVKYKSSISKSDTKSLVKFCKKFGVKKGVMVTKDIKRAENVDGVKIEFIPIEEFLLK
ncbi:MAG TPA: DUF4143 domain-containing protein, partial [Candidatus Aenigmarchaeota archaeon]|nr:DUF4143 domain-containing protein [Candidatus Aenigmarchaeota archaeon]